jgi:hypothetical protein
VVQVALAVQADKLAPEVRVLREVPAAPVDRLVLAVRVVPEVREVKQAAPVDLLREEG